MALSTHPVSRLPKMTRADRLWWLVGFANHWDMSPDLAYVPADQTSSQMWPRSFSTLPPSGFSGHPPVIPASWGHLAGVTDSSTLQLVRLRMQATTEQLDCQHPALLVWRNCH